MGELNNEVIRGFNISPKRIIKEKNYYLCQTDKCFTQISLSYYNEDDIRFSHSVKEFLNSSGFSCTDRFYTGVNGEPFVVYHNDVYTMTDAFNYPDADFYDTDNFLEIISVSAKMHRILKSTNLEAPRQSIAKLDDCCQNDSNNLFRLRKNLSGKNRLSDFDVMLKKNLEVFSDMIAQSYNALNTAEYEVALRSAAVGKGVCHNLLKEENIKFVNNGHYIINFSECANGHYCGDLAFIIKRYFSSSSDNRCDVNKIISVYNADNPLCEQDVKALYGLLLYPDKFMKIAYQYNQKKRSWVPGTYMARLSSVIETNDGFIEYISPLKF